MDSLFSGRPGSARSITACLAGLLLVLTGCAQASPASDAAASGDTVVTSASEASGGDDVEPPEPTATTSSSDSSSESDEPETLASLLGGAARIVTGGGGGGGAGGGGFDADAAAEQQRLVQEAIRSCMADLGWEYTVEVATLNPRQQLAAANAGLNDLEPDDFAEQYGFGISTRFDTLLDGGLAAFDAADEEESANDLMLASMAEAEADAWQQALVGERPERDAEGRIIDPETGEVVAGGRRQGRQPGGCTADAQAEVRGDQNALQELADLFDEVERRIEADPRIDEMNREWSSCMAEAGYTFETIDEAEDSIRTELGPLVRELFRRGGPRGGQGDETVGATGLTAEEESALDALQDRERELGLASHICGADFAEETAQIQMRYEADFIEQNRDVLESISG